MTVFSLSYIARLVTLANGNGLVLFLLMITQLNDVSQYISGKMFGRTPLAPTLSPNKTREGMLGGLATTAVIASFLGPLLTPLSSLIAVIYGTALALAGVAGDLTVSAIKRMAGVKDAGKLLPGHGGFFDRVDSLIYTAPLFFYGILVWQEMQPY
ncbi:MAG: phosphatidate cytidylyltransferase [Propionivibrio sp.]|nr:phosphatidate cytidylyltransferase [Propionivibrio sp.]